MASMYVQGSGLMLVHVTLACLVCSGSGVGWGGPVVGLAFVNHCGMHVMHLG